MIANYITQCNHLSEYHAGCVPLHGIIFARIYITVISQMRNGRDELIEYTVRPGDTFYGIARKFSIPTELLRSANPDIPMNTLNIGQIILLPYTHMVRTVIDVNGFALPTINIRTLEDKLPYLSWLSPLSYTVQSNGMLHYTDDTAVCYAAHKAGVATMMVVSNIVETGAYSGTLVHDVLSSQNAQRTLLKTVITQLHKKRHYGLIVDFQHIFSTDYAEYAKFMQAVSESLRPLGYIVCATVRLSVITQERSRLNEALQYTNYRRFFNNCILMNNECPPADGTMQSLDLLQGAVEFSTSLFPSQMMLLGMTNCCYDWLVISQNEHIPRQLSIGEAGALSNYAQRGIEVDSSTRMPFFQYHDIEGNPHIVCPESAETANEKLSLIQDYNLGGASLYRIDLCSLDCFLAIAVHFEIRKPLAVT